MSSNKNQIINNKLMNKMRNEINELRKQLNELAQNQTNAIVESFKAPPSETLGRRKEKSKNSNSGSTTRYPTRKKSTATSARSKPKSANKKSAKK